MSIGRWMDKEVVVCIHNGILFTTKKKASGSVLMRWMNLKPIIQREVSHKEKSTFWMLMLIYRILKDGTDGPTCRASVETQTKRTALRTQWRKQRRCWDERRERQWNLHVQFSSVAQSCPTLRHPIDCSTPGLPVHHQLPKLARTRVHRVGGAIQPSYPLWSLSPPAFNLSQHQGLFQWVFASGGQSICKIDSQWAFAVWLKELKLVVCDKPRSEGWGGSEAEEGGDMCIPMADPCWSVAETNTTL